VDANDVNISVEDDETVLTGTVDSWIEYGAAQDNAYDGGAVYVDNNMVVKWL
jgi:osmotically-inducible protein OsmY